MPGKHAWKGYQQGVYGQDVAGRDYWNAQFAKRGDQHTTPEEYLNYATQGGKQKLEEVGKWQQGYYNYLKERGASPQEAKAAVEASSDGSTPGRELDAAGNVKTAGPMAPKEEVNPEALDPGAVRQPDGSYKPPSEAKKAAPEGAKEAVGKAAEADKQVEKKEKKAVEKVKEATKPATGRKKGPSAAKIKEAEDAMRQAEAAKARKAQADIKAAGRMALAADANTYRFNVGGGQGGQGGWGLRGSFTDAPGGGGSLSAYRSFGGARDAAYRPTGRDREASQGLSALQQAEQARAAITPSQEAPLAYDPTDPLANLYTADARYMQGRQEGGMVYPQMKGYANGMMMQPQGYAFGALSALGAGVVPQALGLDEKIQGLGLSVPGAGVGGGGAPAPAPEAAAPAAPAGGADPTALSQATQIAGGAGLDALTGAADPTGGVAKAGLDFLQTGEVTGEGVGTALGTAFGGPLGGAIGGAIGGLFKDGSPMVPGYADGKYVKREGPLKDTSVRRLDRSKGVKYPKQPSAWDYIKSKLGG